MESIVYQTNNTVNGKIYVGVHSTKNPDVFDGYLGSGDVLLLAVKKYGKNQFIRETLFTYETPEEAYLKEREIVNEEFVARKDTYNLRVGGEGSAGGKNNPMFGRHHTEESNEKNRNSQLGEKGNFFGKHHSEETKKKISNIHKGKYVSCETRKKISDANKGKHHSQETRRKMSNHRQLSIEIVEKRRCDIIQISKVLGWQVQLARKWSVGKSAVGHFIKKYASDLLIEVDPTLQQRRNDIKEILKVGNWKKQLENKWNISRTGVYQFIKRHASDLIKEVV